jgi:hypothetical protein
MIVPMPLPEMSAFSGAIFLALAERRVPLKAQSSS